MTITSIIGLYWIPNKLYLKENYYEKSEYTKEAVEKLVLDNFCKEVSRAEKSNDRRENYVSEWEYAGDVWVDFDYLPDDLTFKVLLE